MTGRPPKPAEAPGFWESCDLGFCYGPAEVWVWSAEDWAWLPACKPCALQEAS